MSVTRGSPQNARLPIAHAGSSVPAIMRPAHLALALVVALIWGGNFVPIKTALDDYPPFLLLGLRFVIAALPIFFVPRPPIAWHRLILIGLVHFTAQFSFLFLAMAHGMPPGLAALVMQSQAFFTVLFASFILRERPSTRQTIGLLLALCGLSLIGFGIGGDATLVGFGLTLAAAASWACGNIMVRGLGKIDMMPFVIWASAVPLVPALAMSLIFEGPDVVMHALAHPSLPGLASLLYLGFLSTLAGWGIWNYLLKLYPASIVAPFSLLIPVFGATSAWFAYGERFGPTRLGGMALILAGLAVVTLRLPRLFGARSRRIAHEAVRR
jgi:O-acetylserine/cysteine efflux transporter